MEETKKETVNGYYQLCPKCNGEGIVINNTILGTSSSVTRTCPVCNGAKTLYHPPVILSSLISALEKEISPYTSRGYNEAIKTAISLVKQTMKTE